LHFNAVEYFAFNFSSTNAAGGFGISIMGDIAPIPGPYPPGPAFVRNNNQNNGTFFQWTDSSPPNPPGSNSVDLGFRSFMLVPEPSTLMLLGIGAISLLGYSEVGHSC
jgi:hypothetical protein